MGTFSVRKTTKEFINEAISVHGNKYDYSKLEYKTTMDKVLIICPIHGEFWQTAMSHTKGFGCKKCGVEKRSRNRKYKTKDFVEKAIKIHNHKYDYSLVKYSDIKTKVKIICLIHGVFIQKPGDHINNKAGCPECKKEALSLNKEEFIRRSREKHLIKYDYSKVKYSNNFTKIDIICPTHGLFHQEPHSHLKGYGCRKCGRTTSNGELELINFLKKNNIIILENNKEILKGKEIDIIINDKKIGIEFNGLYWHSELFKDKNYHLYKTNLAKDNGYNLIHIFEDEWKLKKNIVKSIIKSKLGIISNKIFARKCEVINLDVNVGKKFLEENHLQGYAKSNIRIGLKYNNELVCVMTFEKLRKSLGNKENSSTKYLLNRYTNKINHTVIGGASKLLKFFIKNNNCSEIISYADKRYSSGELYDKLGFTEVHTTNPDYSYFHNKSIVRKHRFNFRKTNLKKMGFDINNKTEHEIMLEQGYLRIYDCGKIKYKLVINE